MGKQSKRVTFEDLEGRESILAVANRTNTYLLLLFFYSVFANEEEEETNLSHLQAQFNI